MSGRQAMVIGAGLAGAAVCERLCAHGWRVDLIDGAAAPAAGASGNHAGVFHPLIAGDDSLLARLTRAGVLHALGYWRGLEATGAHFDWSDAGMLQLGRPNGRSAGRDDAAVLARLGLGPDFAHAVDARAASELAGLPLAEGGVFFAAGGWVRPAALVRAQLAACGARLRTHFGRTVATAQSNADGWKLADAAGRVIASAPVVILAAGAGSDLARLFGQRHWPVDSVFGQLSYLPAGSVPAPRIALAREAYVLPAIDGIVVTGATYERDVERTAQEAHRLNLQKLERLYGVPLPAVGVAMLTGRRAARAVAPDRLPLIGPLFDQDAPGALEAIRKGAHLKDLPRLPGVYTASAYASRGLTWAALGAELVASMAEGENPALEGRLIEAVDPARFALRALRRAVQVQ